MLFANLKGIKHLHVWCSVRDTINEISFAMCTNSLIKFDNRAQKYLQGILNLHQQQQSNCACCVPSKKRESRLGGKFPHASFVK